MLKGEDYTEMPIITIIHITHDLDAVKECRNVIGLENGRIFYEGPAADFLGKVTGRGVGRGAAYVVIVAGICMAAVAAYIMVPKCIRELEK